MSAKNFNIPNSLSEELFRKALKFGLNVHECQIEDVQVSLGCSAGDNYASTIYRVSLKYRTNQSEEFQDISFIVKSVDSKNTECVNQSNDSFGKEVSMYTSIIPIIEKLYGYVETFAPRLYYAESDLNYRNIVLEDLNASGYIVPDRIKRLDENGSKMVMQKLGKFHAANMVLHKQEPQIFEMYNKGFFQLECYDEIVFQNLYVQSLEQIIELISTWKGYEIITEKLRKVYKTFRERVLQCLTPKPNEIRTLIHADLWTNNILFKYLNGNICNVNFIDFPLAINGSIGIDIAFFLNTSIQNDVLRNNRQELLRQYYDSLRDSLERFHYSEIPSWKDVHNEILGKEFFGFMVAVGEHSIMVLNREASKDSTCNTVADSKALWKKRAIVYSTPDYQEFLKFSLERFNNLGVFD